MNRKKLLRVIAVCTAFLGVGVFAFTGCNKKPVSGGDSSVVIPDEETPKGETPELPDGGNQGGSDEGGDTGNQGGSDTDPEPTDPDEGVKDPVISGPVNGGPSITKSSKNELEAAYVQWTAAENAKWYNVYCKVAGEAQWQQLDAPLVRQYKEYYRADIPGLKAGEYDLKVVPVSGEDEEVTDYAATCSGITVAAQTREGYAFTKGNVPGAYNADGTLKEGAQVVYVTAANAKTVTATVNGAVVAGFQSIIDAYSKGVTDPICFRIVGTVSLGDLDHISSSAEGLQIKGSSASKPAQNITVEGIGRDGTINGFGILIRNSKNIEVKNLGVVNFMDDGISIDTGNSHLWVHNLDIFYGNAGGDADQAKGDGSLDSKGSDYCTYSYNHFWDSGKSNLLGNGDSESSGEGGATHLTYHHNWYDHSDSRHPRIRTATVHVYNNYFDGNAKYGVGVTTGASAFVENNYFRSTAAMRPMMSSLQGTDATGDGTFSGESGGMIKAFGNIFDCSAANLKLLTQKDTSSDNIDCYLASNRDEKVPDTYKTKSGGTTYNNFDTASDFYEYTPDSAEQAKLNVERYAGRIDGGDLKWDFDDATEDANYSIIPGLKAAVVGYKSSVLKIGGAVVSDGSTGGGNEGGDSGNEGGESGGTTTPVEPPLSGDVTKVEFKNGTYPAGITVSGNYSKTGYLKMETATKVTVTVSEDRTITVHTNTPSKNIKINGAKIKTDSNGDVEVTIKANEILTITKGDTMELEYILFG